MAESPESQLQGLDLQGKNVLLDEKGKFILYYSAVKTQSFMPLTGKI